MLGVHESLTSRADRLSAYGRFLEASARLRRPEYAELAGRLAKLAMSCTQADEREFAATLRDVVQGDESSMVGWSWKRLDDAKEAAKEEFTKTLGRAPQRGDRYFFFFLSPKSDRLVLASEDLAAMFTSARDDPQRQGESLYLLCQLVMARTALLKEVVELCYYASSKPAPGHDKNSWARERLRFVWGQSSGVRQWLNLGWINGIRLPLGDLRHAIAHGDVRVLADRVQVFTPETDRLVTELSREQLLVYAEAAGAVWTTFCLEMMYHIAFDADDEGWITLNLGTVDGGFDRPMHPYRPPPPPSRVWNIGKQFGRGAPQFLTTPVPPGGAAPQVWEDARQMILTLIMAAEDFSENAQMLAGLAGYDRGESGDKGGERETALWMLIEDARHGMREHLSDPGPLPRQLIRCAVLAAGAGAQLLSMNLDHLTLGRPDPRETRQERRRRERRGR